MKILKIDVKTNSLRPPQTTGAESDNGGACPGLPPLPSAQEDVSLHSSLSSPSFPLSSVVSLMGQLELCDRAK